MSSDLIFEKIYAHVPAGEREKLLHFRRTHPPKKIILAGKQWEYISSGRSEETLLILPGLLGIAEMSFQQILGFEDEYRVIVPSYPFHIYRMDELVEGIVGILDEEQIDRAHVLGGSYGGMLAQRLVRRYPERVERLILSHTGGPEPERAHKNRRVVQILRILPLSILRSMIKAATSKSMQDAPAQRPFWEAYTNEVVKWLSKTDIISRYQVAIDFDATSNFTCEDLQDWPGRILILEGDNDPIAEASARAALKAFHPQARVHTFEGTGHVASIARVDEYISVIKDFLKD